MSKVGNYGNSIGADVKVQLPITTSRIPVPVTVLTLYSEKKNGEGMPSERS